MNTFRVLRKTRHSASHSPTTWQVYVPLQLRLRAVRGYVIIFVVAIKIRDRRGVTVELTDERWAHICQAHPELANYKKQVLDTIRLGSKSQDPLDPSLWKYSRSWPGLPQDFTSLVVVVRQRKTRFVVTAYGVE